MSYFFLWNWKGVKGFKNIQEGFYFFRKLFRVKISIYILYGLDLEINIG